MSNRTAATHPVLDWLTAADTARRRVEYSLGWSIGQTERAAIAALPTSAWSPALHADGGVHDGAQVAELTGLLHLPGWPARMRVIVRRERPHPGEAWLSGTTVNGRRAIRRSVSNWQTRQVTVCLGQLVPVKLTEVLQHGPVGTVNRHEFDWFGCWPWE